MINKLKTFAIAMMLTGATVATVNAKTTNVLQNVTVTFTVYGEKSTATTGSSLKTSDIITAVSNALGTNIDIDKHATLGVLSVLSYTNTVSTTNTNATPVYSTNVENGTNLLVLETNFVPILTNSTLTGATGSTNGPSTTTLTNVTIGNPAGNVISITGTNVTIITAGPDGPTTNNSGDLTNSSITLDANGAAVIGGTNIPVEVGVSSVSLDTNTVTITTPSATTTNLPIGTNTVSIVGTNIVINGTTNAFATNAVVTIGTNIIVSSNTPVGFGTSTNSFSTSLTSVIEPSLVVTTNAFVLVAGANGETNTVIATNLAVVTETTDYSVTNATNVIGYKTNIVVEGSSELVLADKGTNWTIPPSVLSITNEPSTNDLVTASTHVTNSYSIKSLVLNATNANALSLKFQGLVHSTTAVQNLGTGRAPIDVLVTNEAWTDVSGYGSVGAAPIVGGGTVSVGAPAKEVSP